jgi:hypothetical protein
LRIADWKTGGGRGDAESAKEDAEGEGILNSE